jgi:tetratricopeptide (TPR) repeat protein
MGDFDSMVRSLYNMSLCYFKDEKYKLAEEKVKECLNLINTNSWKDSKRFLPGLEMISGAINHKKNEIDEGYGKFKKAFLRYKECDNKSGMGRAMNNIALCLWNMNKLEETDKAFKEALKYKESCNDRTLADTYINYSEFLKEQVDINKAFGNILNAEEKMLQIKDKEGTLKIFIEKFKYTCEMEDFDKAEVYGFIALDYSQKLANKKAEAEIYIGLSEMYKKTGDFELSVEYALKAKKLVIRD